MSIESMYSSNFMEGLYFYEIQVEPSQAASTLIQILCFLQISKAL